MYNILKEKIDVFYILKKCKIFKMFLFFLRNFVVLDNQSNQLCQHIYKMSKTLCYQKDTHMFNGQFQNDNTKSCVAK